MVGEMGPGLLHQLLRDGQGIAELPILIRNGQVAELSGDQHLQLVRFGLGAKAGAIGLIPEPPEDSQGGEEAQHQQSTDFFHRGHTFQFRRNAIEQYTDSIE